MRIEIKNGGTWQHGRVVVGADAVSESKRFINAVAKRLKEDGYEVRITAASK